MFLFLIFSFDRYGGSPLREDELRRRTGKRVLRFNF
jgi:hypothetical protein